MCTSILVSIIDACIKFTISPLNRGEVVPILVLNQHKILSNDPNYTNYSYNNNHIYIIYIIPMCNSSKNGFSLLGLYPTYDSWDEPPSMELY